MKEEGIKAAGIEKEGKEVGHAPVFLPGFQAFFRKGLFAATAATMPLTPLSSAKTW
ncbi:MAG TPA: hypothetical protein VI685_03585 [Candidatus Angelobacter sp.]